MTEPGESLEKALLQHAERQTSALETIRGLMLFFLALAILGILIWLATAFG